jgi:hypothetical protein
MIQPDEKSQDMSSEAHAYDQKRLSRRSVFKKAVQGGVVLYVAPQILHSELVRAQGVVSGLASGSRGGGGTDVLPFLGIPALGGLAAAGGGGAGVAALAPLIGEAPAGGGSPIAPGTTVAEGGVPGAAGTPGSPLGPDGPRATLPPEPIKRRRGLKRKGPQSNEGPRKIRGLW